MAEEREQITLESLDEDMEDWGEFYQKFKYQLEKITEYEQRIDKLEEILARSRGGFSKKSETRKLEILTITGFFVIAARIFFREISRSNDPRLFFFGGILVGLGAAGLLKMWVM